MYSPIEELIKINAPSPVIRLAKMQYKARLRHKIKPKKLLFFDVDLTEEGSQYNPIVIE